MILTGGALPLAGFYGTWGTEKGAPAGYCSLNSTPFCLFPYQIPFTFTPVLYQSSFEVLSEFYCFSIGNPKRTSKEMQEKYSRNVKRI